MVKKTKGYALVMNATYSFIFLWLKHFFYLFSLTSVSDKHGNKNKTTILSQPVTTIKGQSFQVVLDNEAFFFFFCQTNGFFFLHCFAFLEKKETPKFKLQIDIFFNFLLLIIQIKEDAWNSFLAAITFTVKKKKKSPRKYPFKNERFTF